MDEHRKEHRMRKSFLRQEKWEILLFVVAMAAGYISSVILIGGPVTYSGPAGCVTGFLLYQAWKYRRFKKEWKLKEQPKFSNGTFYF